MPSSTIAISPSLEVGPLYFGVVGVCTRLQGLRDVTTCDDGGFGKVIHSGDGRCNEAGQNLASYSRHYAVIMVRAVNQVDVDGHRIAAHFRVGC